MEMWYGASSADAPNADTTWTGAFRTIPNLAAIFGGHFVGVPESSTWKFVQRSPVAAADGHVVQQVFANAQDVDYGSKCGQCVSGTCPATGPNTGNVLLVQVNPATQKASCYMRSTNTGNYLQADGRTWGPTQYDQCQNMDWITFDAPQQPAR
jgi:hypothetical protein